MISSCAATAAASERFRFRFVVRGDQTAELLMLAVQSLERCHPGTHVAVVDANDVPRIDSGLLGTTLRHTVVHIRPGSDPVARIVGRGSRRHLFYWRHSPEVRKALPAFDGFDVHADADLLFLRPLDLAALLGPLSRGRIAASVDESSLDHYAAVSVAAGQTAGGPFPGGRFGGPMWQAGFLFSNPADDGGLFDLFWQATVEVAAAGQLVSLPDDDMAIVAMLLGCGGPLWERALALGHDWNYITDAVKDPGVLGRVAHFGGRRAKGLLLRHAPTMFPARGAYQSAAWGTIYRKEVDDEDGVSPRRGLWILPEPDDGVDTAAPLPVPFCLTWPVPTGVQSLQVAGNTIAPDGASSPASVAVLVSVDGRQVGRWVTSESEGRISVTVETAAAETVTVITAGNRAGLMFRMSPPAPAEAGNTT